MKKIRYALLLIIYLNTLLAAPASDLGIGKTTFSADTLQFEDILTINTFIVNYDTAAFQGAISLTYELNGVENVDEKMFPNPFEGQQLSIPAHDSIPAIIHIIISPSYFLPGPDILVVWPVCPDSSNPFNLLRDTIYVIEDPAGISSAGAASQELKVYSSLNTIFIYNNGTENSVNRVIIYDAIGREIISLVNPENKQQIPFNNQAPGIYFVAIRLLNGEEMTFKVINY